MVPPASYPTCRPLLPPVLARPSPVKARDLSSCFRNKRHQIQSFWGVMPVFCHPALPAAALLPTFHPFPPQSRQPVTRDAPLAFFLNVPRPVLAWASQILGRLVWLPCGICCLLPRVSFFRFCPFLCLLALCLEEFDRV